jgi:peptidoglycan/xylan/chitin deacetylase (PgdA/CDA1 family)
MVNRPPYECEWDTRQTANGIHEVRIQGNDKDGYTLTSRTLKVLVRNPVHTPALTRDEAEAVERELRKCLQLQPSRRFAFYLLARCAAAEKDEAAELLALERTVAIDPNYRDARALLIRRYGALQAYHEITRVDQKKKLAAITFDDGPGAATAAVLDVLADKSVTATFFVLGATAHADPQMVERIALLGHEIESRGYSGSDLKTLSVTDVEQDLIRAVWTIRSLTGMSSRFFRLSSHRPKNVRAAAERYGFTPVSWSVHCAGKPGLSPQEIARRTADAVSPGAIILIRTADQPALAALPLLIDELKARNYKLTTLAGMLNTR